MNLQEIAAHISLVNDRPFVLDKQSNISGGSINSALKITGSGQSYFMKLNDVNRLSMFEAEAAGLAELARASAIRVPEPVCTGVSGAQAYIVMEYLQLGSADSSTMAKLGEQLAQLHRYTCPQFGWQHENTIGATPQINTWAEDWLVFYATSRLGVQIDLAVARGIGSSTVDAVSRIMDSLGDFFGVYQPQASLLHGDLWSGNYGILNGADPVIFDPAIYYGDREADMAMTELFGGFGAEFYAAYNASWPMDAGYSMRKSLYNLYHILNHFNMFGGGYGTQAGSMARQLLSNLA